MSLSETIPRVIRSHLELRGWSLTHFGKEIAAPPASCDQTRKWIASAGRDLRRLDMICTTLGVRVSEVVAAAERLDPAAGES